MPLCFIINHPQGRLSEYAEIDTAIGAVLNEPGMGGEVVVLAVLEDEDAFGGEDVLLEDEVGYLRQFLEGVGRVGEDEVKLLSA